MSVEEGYNCKRKADICKKGTACDRSRQAGCDRFDRYVKSK